MSVQTKVNVYLANGVPGTDATNNPQGGSTSWEFEGSAFFGKVFTSVTGIKAKQGFTTATDKFVGIAVDPKSVSSKNPIGTNNLQIFGQTVSLRTVGDLFVEIENIALWDDNVEYDNLGNLYAITGTTPTSGRAIISGAKVVKINDATSKVVQIKLGA